MLDQLAKTHVKETKKLGRQVLREQYLHKKAVRAVEDVTASATKDSQIFVERLSAQQEVISRQEQLIEDMRKSKKELQTQLEMEKKKQRADVLFEHKERGDSASAPGEVTQTSIGTALGTTVSPHPIPSDI